MNLERDQGNGYCDIINPLLTKDSLSVWKRNSWANSEIHMFQRKLKKWGLFQKDSILIVIWFLHLRLLESTFFNAQSRNSAVDIYYQPFNHETVIQFLRNPELYLITRQSVRNEFAKILWQAQADVCNMFSKGAAFVLWLLLARIPPRMPFPTFEVAASRFLGMSAVWISSQK